MFLCIFSFYQAGFFCIEKNTSFRVGVNAAKPVLMYIKIELEDKTLYTAQILWL